MNKWLLRLLKQLTKRIRPKLSALIIRTISQRVEGVRNQRELGKRIRGCGLYLARTLRQCGGTKAAASQLVKTVKVLKGIWALVFTTLWKTSHKSIIFLLNWLEPSLGNDQVPEKIDIVFEGVRYRLLNKHWPPTRQRCDSIPLCLLTFAERFLLYFY